MATNIKNRVPVYPGRVKLIPVEGQENTYDMERADSPTEEGTSVNKDLLDEIGIHQMDYAYAENNHALAGLNGAGGLVNAIFIPSQNFSQNDTFTVDGTSYTGKLQSDDELYNNFFIAGAVVSCVLDTENHTINFKSSGGSVKYASGTVTLNGDSNTFSVTGLDFTPQYVWVSLADLEGEGIRFAANMTENSFVSITGYYDESNDYYQTDYHQITGSFASDGFTLNAKSSGYSYLKFQGYSQYFWQAWRIR